MNTYILVKNKAYMIRMHLIFFFCLSVYFVWNIKEKRVLNRNSIYYEFLYFYCV